MDQKVNPYKYPQSNDRHLVFMLKSLRLLKPTNVYKIHHLFCTNPE